MSEADRDRFRGAFEDWAESVTGPDWTWWVKRLAGNDTLLTDAHQAGPYVPKPVFFRVFPAIEVSDRPNPDIEFPMYLDSHGELERVVRGIWYNQKTRDESRLTRFGGGSSPLLDPESTGALVVYAFHKSDPRRNSDLLRVWLCSDVTEEDRVEEVIGAVVEPGSGIVFSPGLVTERPQQLDLVGARSCQDVTIEDLPLGWRVAFPTGGELVEEAFALVGRSGLSPDDRLLDRRECETHLFYLVEAAHVLPLVKQGFDSVDAFVTVANSVLNRRKARSGRSLELHVREILNEEGVAFEYQVVLEKNRRPDFLFPSVEAYRAGADGLRMLAVKTTCRERWNQVVNEAARIPIKHLLTIQEGVAPSEFKKMMESGIRLVVPKRLHKRYPREARQRLLTFEQFISGVRTP